MKAHFDEEDGDNTEKHPALTPPLPFDDESTMGINSRQLRQRRRAEKRGGGDDYFDAELDVHIDIDAMFTQLNNMQHAIGRPAVVSADSAGSDDEEGDGDGDGWANHPASIPAGSTAAAAAAAPATSAASPQVRHAERRHEVGGRTKPSHRAGDGGMVDPGRGDAPAGVTGVEQRIYAADLMSEILVGTAATTTTTTTTTVLIFAQRASQHSHRPEPPHAAPRPTR